MKGTFTKLAIGALAAAAFSLPAMAQSTPEVTLTRLDCGTTPSPTDVNLRFSDTFAFVGLKLNLVFSCYLIKHGDEYLLWDTGQAMTAGPVAPKTSIVDLLAQLKLKPEQMKYVGISHYHGDHTGQLASFPNSQLLIGSADWAAVSAPNPAPLVNAPPFAHWVKGAGKSEVLPGDKDVFGDGTVVILSTPGHTPGHRVLLVKLAQMGNVLLSGDLVHFRENYETNGVPTFNTSRAETLASIDRFKKLVTNYNATVIIQHDARDVAKLPAFPAAAR
jgi:N-acyl homoserine lactone hydrolase